MFCNNHLKPPLTFLKLLIVQRKPQSKKKKVNFAATKTKTFAFSLNDVHLFIVSNEL